MIGRWLSVGLLCSRLVFVLMGWFDVEVGPAVVEGLKHPYLVVYEAPYGVLWYLVNLPLSWLQLPFVSGDVSWLIWTSLIDSVVLWWVFSRVVLWVGVGYLWLSVLSWWQAPYNLSVLWFVCFGLWRWWFLVVAPLVKFPVGAGLEVWRFVLGSSVGLLGNWRYYGILVLWWLVVLVFVLRGRISGWLAEGETDDV